MLAFLHVVRQHCAACKGQTYPISVTIPGVKERTQLRKRQNFYASAPSSRLSAPRTGGSVIGRPTVSGREAPSGTDPGRSPAGCHTAMAAGVAAGVGPSEEPGSSAGSPKEALRLVVGLAEPRRAPTLRPPPLPGLAENDEPRRALPMRGVITGEPGPEATAASRGDSTLRGPSS